MCHIETRILYGDTVATRQLNHNARIKRVKSSFIISFYGMITVKSSNFSTYAQR
jgi:hypothetical protein